MYIESMIYRITNLKPADPTLLPLFGRMQPNANLLGRIGEVEELFGHDCHRRLGDPRKVDR